MKNLFYSITFSEVENAIIANDYDFQSVNDKQLLLGSTITTWPNSASIFVTGQVLTDYLFCPLRPWLVVSDKVRELTLENSISGVQFLDVNVITKEGRVLRGYSIMNILSIVNGLNFEETKWLSPEKWNVEYPELNISEICLRSQSVDSYDVFRITEDITQVFISYKYWNLLHLRNACKGFLFLPVYAK